MVSRSSGDGRLSSRSNCPLTLFSSGGIFISSAHAQSHDNMILAVCAAVASWQPGATLLPRAAGNSCLRLTAARRLYHPSLSQSTPIEATAVCAEEQRAEFFALMPSEELPRVSLDLRLFRSKDDDHYQAKVYARQAGTVPAWADVGMVAVEEDGLFEEAVAKQRALISSWAHEVCNDFETNELLIDLEEPIELAWAVQPPKAQFWEKQPEIRLTTVPTDATFEPTMRCGFLGKVSREYRGGGAMPRFERIVLGQPPAVPERRSENWGSSGGPYGVKARQEGARRKESMQSGAPEDQV